MREGTCMVLGSNILGWSTLTILLKELLLQTSGILCSYHWEGQSICWTRMSYPAVPRMKGIPQDRGTCSPLEIWSKSVPLLKILSFLRILTMVILMVLPALMMTATLLWM
ncbi:hypothetical protein ACET3Z_010613 [Daucus carota]